MQPIYTSPFIRIPAELNLMICKNVDLRDLSSLRSTSHEMNENSELVEAHLEAQQEKAISALARREEIKKYIGGSIRELNAYRESLLDCFFNKTESEIDKIVIELKEKNIWERFNFHGKSPNVELTDISANDNETVFDTFAAKTALFEDINSIKRRMIDHEHLLALAKLRPASHDILQNSPFKDNQKREFFNRLVCNNLGWNLDSDFNFEKESRLETPDNILSCIRDLFKTTHSFQDSAALFSSNVPKTQMLLKQSHENDFKLMDEWVMSQFSNEQIERGKCNLALFQTNY